MLKKMLSENKGTLLKEIFHHLQPKPLLNIGKTPLFFRVNAYMPDDNIGIPKPYGNHQPFKPTSLGTNMRHIKKP